MTKMPPKARETPLVVLHVARAPHTGVWSVIKTLATAQQSAGAVVYLGLFLPLDWPYHDELAHLGVPFFTGTSPGIFGTAAFAYHTLRPGCLRSWIAQVQRTHPGALVAVHYHNAWLSGAFLSPRLSASSVRQIATFHGVAGQSQLCKQPVRRFIHRAWAQRLLRAKCILTSVDTQNLETARELFGLPPTEFHIIPNGVRTLPMPSGSLQDIDRFSRPTARILGLKSIHPAEKETLACSGKTRRSIVFQKSMYDLVPGLDFWYRVQPSRPRGLVLCSLY
jgi:hypothetical protein